MRGYRQNSHAYTHYEFLSSLSPPLVPPIATVYSRCQPLLPGPTRLLIVQTHFVPRDCSAFLLQCVGLREPLPAFAHSLAGVKYRSDFLLASPH